MLQTQTTVHLPKVDTGPFVFGANAIAPAHRLSFREFVNKVNPHYQWYTHTEVLAERLEQVASDELDRLLIFWPPRHGKSEEVSRLFSAYYLYKHPERWVGINSYGAELAYTFSRSARENYQRAGGVLKDDAKAVKHWQTNKKGGLWAAGVGGPITGKGFHLGIIDDPLKNAEEAESELIREKHKDWYDSTFYTRAEPGASIIVIQTRWHEDDLSGWLLSEEVDEPERWHIVNLPAISEDERDDFPDTCTVEPDWREPDRALCPERYSYARLEKIRKRIGSYFWAALYQQRPRPREGNMFKRAWFEIVSAVPRRARRVRYWDLASTQDDGALTAGVLMAQPRSGVCYVEDAVMGQWSKGERNQIMKQTAQLDAQEYGNSVQVWIEQEPGSSGKDAVNEIIRLLSGFPVRADKVTGSKEVRADPFAAQCEAGNVKLVKGDWNKRYLDIVTAFPMGKFKDPVDASSGGYNKLQQNQYAPPGTSKYA